jgi:hypothetical protein
MAGEILVVADAMFPVAALPKAGFGSFAPGWAQPCLVAEFPGSADADMAFDDAPTFGEFRVAIG